MPSFTTAPDPPTSDAFKRRYIAGRITADPLRKRDAGSTIESLGGCALQTPAATPLVRPGWPSVFNDLINPEKAGNLDPKYSNIPRYDRATQEACVYTTTRLSANDFMNAPGDWMDFAGKNYGENNKPSLDHACK